MGPLFNEPMRAETIQANSPGIDERVQRRKQSLDVRQMQSRRRLVEDVDGEPGGRGNGACRPEQGLEWALTTNQSLKRPGLAAITLDERGGGVAAVARLVQSVLTGDGEVPCPTITLSDDPESGVPSLRARVRFGTRILRAHLRRDFDWLFYTHLGLAQAERGVPRFLARPYAVFLHDVEAWGPMSDARRRVMRRAFLRVANSAYTAARVAAAHPSVGSVVACPLALSRIESVLVDGRATPIARRPPHVVTVGRMISSERYKGHDQLIDVWPRVVSTIPDARLTCVGTGDDVDRLRARAASLGVANSVVFPGFVPREVLRDLYNAAAVFAMPSRREGFGLVYLEAMSAGLPCVGSVHDAAGEIIEDGVTGYLVDQSDLDALAARLLRLLSRPEERDAFGRAGRRRFERRFTYDMFASRLRAAVRAARQGGPGSATVRDTPADESVTP
jgi:phosphatidylinositol alpha-1,6-mannosyltransferase